MWKLKYKSFNDGLLLLCNYYCIEIEFDSTQMMSYVLSPHWPEGHNLQWYDSMRYIHVVTYFRFEIKKNILLQSFKLLIIFHFIFDVYQRIAIECEVVGFTILLSKRNNATTLKKSMICLKDT